MVSAEIRTCRNQVAGRSHLPHAEIMTSPNTVLLKRGTERCDMQLSQVTTGNLRRVFQVSSGLVIKIALRHGFCQCSARAGLASSVYIQSLRGVMRTRSLARVARLTQIGYR